MTDVANVSKGQADTSYKGKLQTLPNLSNIMYNHAHVLGKTTCIRWYLFKVFVVINI